MLIYYFHLDDDELVFEASDKLKESIDIDPNQLVSVAGKTDHVFFITHKDRPEFLNKDSRNTIF